MKVLSEFFSDDGHRAATVLVNMVDSVREFRVVCIDSTTRQKHEQFFDHQRTAEEYGEDWVMGENAPL